MPSKSKGAPKAKEQANTGSNPSSANPSNINPKTINERSAYRYEVGNPLASKKSEVGGVQGLSPTERATWTNLTYVRKAQDQKRLPLPNKANKDLWKSINESGVPLRGLDELEGLKFPGNKIYDWGRDRAGRDIGEYTPEQFKKRRGKRLRVTQLEVLGRQFQALRRKVGGLATLEDEEIDKERIRREELAKLRMELYGEKTGTYAQDPEWDDIEPVAQVEGEGALASIAYSDDYAEAMSYLRAVMAKKEHSPRCLRLTENIILMNPAHYTVWLYRFSIISSLNISIKNEIEWLNKVSLAHLKNYQIWHHRQLLLDHFYPLFDPVDGQPATADNSEEVKEFALSEMGFLKKMLDEDAKNYHVWSYRQYLVRKLGLWNLSEEIGYVETLILEDVRNNSAWSHRFFIVFSNPAHASSNPEIPATKFDPKVPADVTEREVGYAKRKIEEAPQNQSPWNYLKGVLARGGKKVEEMEEFCLQFVNKLGEAEEEVTSSHALDMLAEAWAEKGEKEKADLALRRLAEKWDRIREGKEKGGHAALIAPAHSYSSATSRSFHPPRPQKNLHSFGARREGRNRSKTDGYPPRAGDESASKARKPGAEHEGAQGE
ncbi:farnesyltransferase alpha subunit ram2 [Zalerion maritima]|uniref:Protein farnesyltransferase/geranylgeranyltransferase type-1 subunit alpha n=1 Tax=Zalerion maritima TaxID=339359 RepID=A0AAD5RVV0_9PEZI|nr:farnesyltransferase alpha subunit ram2 [Zalerion maritima]